jgi:hypothetical protein
MVSLACYCVLVSGRWKSCLRHRNLEARSTFEKENMTLLDLHFTEQGVCMESELLLTCQVHAHAPSPALNLPRRQIRA